MHTVIFSIALVIVMISVSGCTSDGSRPGPGSTTAQGSSNFYRDFLENLQATDGLNDIRNGIYEAILVGQKTPPDMEVLIATRLSTDKEHAAIFLKTLERWMAFGVQHYNSYMRNSTRNEHIKTEFVELTVALRSIHLELGGSTLQDRDVLLAYYDMILEAIIDRTPPHA